MTIGLWYARKWRCQMYIRAVLKVTTPNNDREGAVPNGGCTPCQRRCVSTMDHIWNHFRAHVES